MLMAILGHQLQLDCSEVNMVTIVQLIEPARVYIGEELIM